VRHRHGATAPCDGVEVTSPTLAAATVNRRLSDVALTWTVDGETPRSGTWLLSTTLTGGADGPIHQFGVKFLDGDLIASFVFDHVAAQQYNFAQVTPQRVGDRWSATFPTADLDIAASGRWRANLTVDGADTEVVEGSF
jgi:hypothetical protein